MVEGIPGVAISVPSEADVEVVSEGERQSVRQGAKDQLRARAERQALPHQCVVSLKTWD